MRIFILEDDPERIIHFYDLLKRHDLTIIHTVEREYDFIPPYDLILLDFDLGGRQLTEHPDDGAAVVRKIRDRIGEAKVILHTWNRGGADQMESLLKEAGITDVRHCPFGGNDLEKALRLLR